MEGWKFDVAFRHGEKINQTNILSNEFYFLIISIRRKFQFSISQPLRMFVKIHTNPFQRTSKSLFVFLMIAP